MTPSTIQGISSAPEKVLAEVKDSLIDRLPPPQRFGRQSVVEAVQTAAWSFI